MSKVFEIAFKLGGELTSSFRNAFDDAGGAIKMVSVAAAALGGTAVLGSLASQVMDMNDSFTQLSAQTGMVGEDLEGLKGVAENLFRNNYGEDFNEVTAALANVKQNMHELNDVDLEKFTGDALMFTKTFDADMNETTRAANNMMSAFGIESSKAMDLFATGAQRGLNFSDEMLDNVAEYAPLFGNMGYSAEEYFGIMERGSKAGVYNLDYVNDAMKEFQIRTKDGSKSTSDAMGSMSKETQNVWKEFMKGNGTVSDVASTVVGELKGMEDQIAAGQIAVSLFGTKWEDLEADAMYAMLGTTDAMTGFEGKMDEINQIQFSSFGAAIQGIGRMLFMDLVYPIGDMVLPYLNEFANYMRDNLPAAIEQAKAAIKQYGPIVLAVAGAFLTYKGVLQGVSGVQKLFGMMLKANPFTLVVGAVVALGAAFYMLYQKSETFRNVIDPMISVLKGAFVAGVTQVGSTVSQVLPTVIAAFLSLATPIKELGAFVLPLLISAAQTVFPALVMVVQTAAPIISNLIGSIGIILTNGVIPAISSLMQIVQTVFPVIQLVIQNALTLITGIIQTAMALLQGDWSGAWEIIKETATTIMDNIVSFFTGINLFDVGKSIITGLIDGIKSMGSAVIGAITNMIPEPIRAAASDIIGKVPEFAAGGVVSSATLAWVGEGGDTESIIPWNNSQRSKDLWLQAGQQIGMLSDSGAMDKAQEQIAMQTYANENPTILPEQVKGSVNNNQGGNSPIIVQFSPQYNVSKAEDLEQIKQHADQDKDDLEARLNEIAHNERRKSFGD